MFVSNVLKACVLLPLIFRRFGQNDPPCGQYVCCLGCECCGPDMFRADRYVSPLVLRYDVVREIALLPTVSKISVATTFRFVTNSIAVVIRSGAIQCALH
jgi:hypothetical protein